MLFKVQIIYNSFIPINYGKENSNESSKSAKLIILFLFLSYEIFLQRNVFLVSWHPEWDVLILIIYKQELI